MYHTPLSGPRRFVVGPCARPVADAETGPEWIDLAVPFGVGTVGHDASEMEGWNAVFGARLEEIPAIATRGATGNNGAGSGALDVAATVMAVYQGTIPPSVNTDTPDETCRFGFVQGQPVDAKIKQAMSLGYAPSGGQSAALVIRRYEE